MSVRLREIRLNEAIQPSGSRELLTVIRDGEATPGGDRYTIAINPGAGLIRLTSANRPDAPATMVHVSNVRWMVEAMAEPEAEPQRPVVQDAQKAKR